jgi:hypothetical protein
MTAYDAWALARLVSGRAARLNGELASVSVPWRPLADLIDSMELAKRLAALQGAIVRDPDREAIERSLREADPMGPAPPIEATAPADGPTVKMTCAADITPRQVEWLWPGRVPLGMLTLLAGDPKLGKSCVTLGIAAAVSRGAPLPGGDGLATRGERHPDERGG